MCLRRVYILCYECEIKRFDKDVRLMQLKWMRAQSKDAAYQYLLPPRPRMNLDLDISDSQFMGHFFARRMVFMSQC